MKDVSFDELITMCAMRIIQSLCNGSLEQGIRACMQLHYQWLTDNDIVTKKH